MCDKDERVGGQCCLVCGNWTHCVGSTVLYTRYFENYTLEMTMVFIVH